MMYLKNLKLTFKRSNVYLLVLLLLLFFIKSNAQMGIGTTSPNNSAQLDISSTSKGILIPRMTEAQRIVIASPAKGLLVFQSNNAEGFYFYNGSAWTYLVDAIESVKKIDNLSDAKSDDDGTNNGSSIFIGINAGLNDDTTDNKNVGIGFEATKNSSIENTAVGYQSLLGGNKNTAIGFQALKDNTGSDNTALGHNALHSNKAMKGSVAIGASAMEFASDITTGAFVSGNTAVGNFALRGSTTASNNTGGANTATGAESLKSNTTGSFNTATGDQSLKANTTGSNNTAIGEMALYYNTTGSHNTAVGERTLWQNDTGEKNTGIGAGALASMGTGDYNTGVGYTALGSNTSGGYNTVIGYASLSNNSSGSNNTAIGFGSGHNCLVGSRNVFLGFQAGFNETSSNVLYIENTVANENNALIYGEFGNDQYTTGNILRTNSVFQIGNPAVNGYAFPTTDGDAGYILKTDGSGQLNFFNPGTLGTDDQRIAGSILTGTNLYIGIENGSGQTIDLSSLQDGTGTDDQNINGSGLSGTTLTIGIENGSNETVDLSSLQDGVGAQKLNDLSDAKSDNDGSDDGSSIFIGVNAGLNDDSSDNRNVGLGNKALTLNTTGSFNVATGYTALYNTTSGSSNVAFGYRAMHTNKANSGSVAVGYGALEFADDRITGRDTYNTAIGYEALKGSATAANNTGRSNTATGFRTLWSTTSGVENTANGEQSLVNNTTGYRNTAIGFKSLYSNTQGNNNTAVGMDAYFTVDNLSNTTCIGFASGAQSNVDNRIEIGNTSVSWIGGQVTWGTYSDARIKTSVQENVPGLDFIRRLRPVTYHLDIHKQNSLINRGSDRKNKVEWESKYDIEKKQMTGFIAQEVAKAALESGYDFSGVAKAKDDLEMYSVKYAEFVVPLVKAVQELEIENKALKERLERIEELLMHHD